MRPRDAELGSVGFMRFGGGGDPCRCRALGPGIAGAAGVLEGDLGSNLISSQLILFISSGKVSEGH